MIGSDIGSRIERALASRMMCSSRMSWSSSSDSAALRPTPFSLATRWPTRRRVASDGWNVATCSEDGPAAMKSMTSS